MCRVPHHAVGSTFGVLRIEDGINIVATGDYRAQQTVLAELPDRDATAPAGHRKAVLPRHQERWTGRPVAGPVIAIRWFNHRGIPLPF